MSEESSVKNQLESKIRHHQEDMKAITADRDEWKAKYDEASVLLATRVESFRLDSAITEANAWKAKAERYRGKWIGYETALEEILKLDASLGTAFSWIDLRAFKESVHKIARAREERRKEK